MHTYKTSHYYIGIFQHLQNVQEEDMHTQRPKPLLDALTMEHMIIKYAVNTQVRDYTLYKDLRGRPLLTTTDEDVRCSLDMTKSAIYGRRLRRGVQRIYTTQTTDIHIRYLASITKSVWNSRRFGGNVQHTLVGFMDLYIQHLSCSEGVTKSRVENNSSGELATHLHQERPPRADGRSSSYDAANKDSFTTQTLDSGAYYGCMLVPGGSYKYVLRVGKSLDKEARATSCTSSWPGEVQDGSCGRSKSLSRCSGTYRVSRSQWRHAYKHKLSATLYKVSARNTQSRGWRVESTQMHTCEMRKVRYEGTKQHNTQNICTQQAKILVGTVHMIHAQLTTQYNKYLKYLQDYTGKVVTLEHYSDMANLYVRSHGGSMKMLQEDEEWQAAVKADWFLRKENRGMRGPRSGDVRIDTDDVKTKIFNPVMAATQPIEYVHLNNNRTLDANETLTHMPATHNRPRLPFVVMSIVLDNALIKIKEATGSDGTTVQDRALIDTGSMFSMLKKVYIYLLGSRRDNFHDRTLSRYKFLAANGTPIDIYGSVAITIFLPSTDTTKKAYTHNFFIVDVADNIVGYDFLHANSLVFNPRTERIAEVASVYGDIVAADMSYRDYRVTSHKQTQTDKHISATRDKMTQRNYKLKRVRFAKTCTQWTGDDLDEKHTAPVNTVWNLTHGSQQKVLHSVTYAVESEGDGKPMLVEFARSGYIQAYTPKAIKKYLAKVHALTVGEDIDVERDTFLQMAREKYPDVFFRQVT